MKFRAVVFHDGCNVVRYSVFRDADSARGFTDDARYELSIREAQALPPRPGRPAEIHIRYDGQAAIAGKGTTVFDGMILLRGDGDIACTTPTIHSGTGKAAILRGAATIGWW